MYNGIGLQTARGSGTNGHVQRNFAFVRPSNKDNIHYRTEEDIAKLEASTNRQPNLEILNHERKRKIEVKCAELEEVLETQGWVNNLNAKEIARSLLRWRFELNPNFLIAINFDLDVVINLIINKPVARKNQYKLLRFFMKPYKPRKMNHSPRISWNTNRQSK